MSDHNHHRPKASRVATWAFLVLIPALAIVALGTGLSLTTGGRAPADGSSADTREFAARGDSVTATFKAAEQGSLSDFADTWQNTVRVPPSPRR